MKGSFLFFGTGASTGVPLIGCDCSICQSNNPCNKRLRPAGLIRFGGKILLVDIGPDFRQQALRSETKDIDGILLTHTHYDHIAGIDEVRVFNERKKTPFPILLSKESEDDLKTRYGYMFKDRNGGNFAASLDCQVLPQDQGEIDFLGVPIRYTSFSQAGMKVNGFRIGNFAYVSDIREYSQGIFDFLKGVDQLVLSALRKDPSHVHFSLQEAADFAIKAKVGTTWLTHLSHKVDYEAACKALPPNVQPGYDGLELIFEG